LSLLLFFQPALASSASACSFPLPTCAPSSDQHQARGQVGVIEVTPVSFDELNRRADGEPSAAVRARVVEARRVQAERFAEGPGLSCKARMGTRLVRRYCKLDEAGQQLMKLAIHRLGLSARAYDRILKVSRTIADLGGSESIRPEHLSEAIQYRSLDRAWWIG
jgi:magnesium chelatase family protein